MEYHVEHIARYDLWCKKCKNEQVDEKDEPCNECLAESIVTDARKPFHFEEKD